MQTNTPPNENPGLQKHAHWLVRFALGSIFLYYGIDKFLGGGLQGFSAASQLPLPVATLVALSEIGGGALVLLGASIGSWTTRIGALLMIPVMLGAIFMVHWGQWHMMATATHPMGGMGFQVGLLFVATYVAIRGNDL